MKIITRELVNISLEFVSNDLWIGVYWKRQDHQFVYRTVIYICILPMLPIDIRLRK